MNPLDRKLEDVVAHTIVADLMRDDVFILDPVDFARRAALDAFRQGIALSAKIVAEMAADEDSERLREAERQILTLPQDVP